jgi:hypothetical protein
MAREVFSDMLLGLAVVIVAGASLGVLLMRDAYQKLHFVTPAALVAPVLVTLDLPGAVLPGDRRALPVARDHPGLPGAGEG